MVQTREKKERVFRGRQFIRKVNTRQSRIQSNFSESFSPRVIRSIQTKRAESISHSILIRPRLSFDSRGLTFLLFFFVHLDYSNLNGFSSANGIFANNQIVTRWLFSELYRGSYKPDRPYSVIVSARKKATVQKKNLIFIIIEWTRQFRKRLKYSWHVWLTSISINVKLEIFVLARSFVIQPN